MATVLSSLSQLLREELAPSVPELLTATDGAFTKIRNTSMGVRRDEGIGRSYQVKHTFFTSLAGAFRWGSPVGSTAKTGPTSHYVDGTPTTFPTISETARPGTTQSTLTLVQGSGNLALPIQVFQADQLSASLTSYVAKTVQATARLVAEVQAGSFYATDSYGSICAIASSTVNGGGTSVDFTVSAGRVNRLYPGMFVDVYDSTGMTQRNSAALCTLDIVNPLGGTARIVTVDGTTDLSDVVNTDIVVPKGSLSQGPSSPYDWIVDSGSVFGVALSGYPQLSSLLASSVGSVTEAILNAKIGQFDDAYGGWVDLDTIITTGGVTREYLTQAEDLGVFQRMGRALDIQGGWASVGYTYNGRKFDWLISRYIAAGHLLVTKLGNQNIKRYVPPRIPGSGRRAEFGGEIEFFSNLAGGNGVFMPAVNGDGAVTEFLQAPFWTLCELAPDFAQSIKLTGCTES